MSEKRKTDFSLNRLDDLFTSQSERENGLTPTIKDIPLEKLYRFRIILASITFTFIKSDKKQEKDDIADDYDFDLITKEELELMFNI